MTRGKIAALMLLTLAPLGNGAGKHWMLQMGTCSGPSASERVPAGKSPMQETTDGRNEPRPLRIMRDKAFGDHPIAFSPDGKTLATGWGNGRIRLWEAASGVEKSQLNITQDDRAWVHALAFSPDGKVLAVASQDKTVHLYNWVTGKEVCRLQVQELAVDAVAFSPDGQFLAAGGRTAGAFTGKVHLWDLRDGKEIHQFDRQERGALWYGKYGIAFSPDGKSLAAGGSKVTLWDVRTGRRLRQFEGEGYYVAFSPDGKMLAGGGLYASTIAVGLDGGLRLPIIYFWEVASGKERRQLKWDPLPPRNARSLIGGGVGVTAIAFSPDGKSLASGGPDQARLWEVATGQQYQLLDGHEGNFFRVTFSPDGRTLATSSGDGKIRIWKSFAPSGGQGSRSPKPSTKELEIQWGDLASGDAVKAYQAVCALVKWSKESVSILEERLRGPRADPHRIPQLITELDSNQFELRRKAMQELEQLGELAEPALQQLLAGKPSPEVRQRAQGLLRMLEERGLPPERLRVLRSIEVLEHIGTPEVLPILESLARGPADDKLTQEAKASLQRLAKRSLAGPESGK